MSDPSTLPRDRRVEVALTAALALASLIVGFVLARPLGSASIAFDSQVAVLHFERIVNGHQLEAFIPTTPKPLLTAIFGTLYTLTGDWRALAIATLGAYVVTVVLGAVLAGRFGGPIGALFAGVAIMLTTTLLFDVGFSLATPWAAIGWLGAGLAVTSHPPRYALAGVALGIATLARLETAVLSGTILLFLAAAWVMSHSSGRGGMRPPGRTWLVPLLALTAFPVMMLHDWRLTGDPLFWSTVAQQYTQRTTLHIPPTGEVVGLIVGRYWALGAVTLLAFVGVADLAARRAWPVLIGLAGLGPGVAVFLVLLASRGIFVSDRYLAAEDLSVALACGIGAATVLSRIRIPPIDALDRTLSRAAVVRVGAPVVVLAASALLVAGPIWQVYPTLPATVTRSRQLAGDSDRAVAAMKPLLDTMPGARDVVGPGGPMPEPIVLGPGPVWPRLVVSLGVALPIVASIRVNDIDVAAGYPAVGQIVFHSLAGDPQATRWSQLEVSHRTVVGAVAIEPLLADTRRGEWVVRLRHATP